MAEIKGTVLICQKQKLTKISQQVATTIMTVKMTKNAQKLLKTH